MAAASSWLGTIETSIQITLAPLLGVQHNANVSRASEKTVLRQNVLRQPRYLPNYDWLMAKMKPYVWYRVNFT